jgi:hypothetical protein
VLEDLAAKDLVEPERGALTVLDLSALESVAGLVT